MYKKIKNLKIIYFPETSNIYVTPSW